jgi:integrase
MGKLTDFQLREWVKAGQPIAGKSDGEGLTFTLSKNGTAAWVMRYRYAGRQRELSIGNYPAMSLKDARGKAAEARARVAAGADVATEKRRQKSELLTSGLVRDLAEDYMLRIGPGLAPSTRKESRRYLDKDILPRIGGRLAKEITGGDIVALVDRVGDRSQAVDRRCYELLSVLFAHGVAKYVTPSNPCAGIKVSAVIGVRLPKRERIKLTRDELALVLTKLAELGQQNALPVRILLSTCARKGELIKARWEHLDIESGIWNIPPENSKTGKGFIVPLPPTVAGWFQALKAMAGNSQFVLPTRARQSGATDRPICHNTLNVALNSLGLDGRHFTPHDLRSTARSYLAELGVSVVVAERCLNHALGGLVEVYDQHDYLEERRHALELWAAFLDKIEKGEAWNVIPIKRGAA